MAHSNVRDYIILFMIFTFALILRVSGLIGFVYGDEDWAVPVRVLAGELSPHNYMYPPLFHYLCAVSYVLMFAVGRLIGVWYSTADFRAQYFADPTPFIFTGRLVSAFLGALSVPLAAMIAWRLSLSWKSALLVGLLVCLLPVDVFYSHIGKSDAAAATAILLLAWSVLRKLDEPEARGGDALIGVASALAASFKQTSVSLVFILLAGMVVMLSWGNRVPLRRIARGLVIAAVVAILAGIAMNIGVLLNPRNFLEYQGMLRQMLAKHDPIAVSAYHLLQMLGDNWRGMTMAGLAAGLVGVCARRDGRFLILWISAVASTIATAALAGSRLHYQYLLPAGLLLYTLGCVAVVSLVEQKRIAKVIGLITLMAILASAMIGSFSVVTQAMRVPTKIRVGEAIKKICQPGHDRILGFSTDLGLPISAGGLKHERDRHERLAKKYGVQLPPRPAEKTQALAERTGGYFIQSIPWVVGGLEDLRAEEVKIVKPFVWPIQYEEWKLDYWIAQGFNIYVIGDEEGLLRSPVEEYSSFVREIKQRCDLMDVISSTLPLFDLFAAECRVYKLRAQPVP